MTRSMKTHTVLPRLALAMALGATPLSAQAAPTSRSTARQVALEARLGQLEAAVAMLSSELSAARSALASRPIDATPTTTTAQSVPLVQTLPPATEARLAALEAARPAKVEDGFRAGNTTIRLGGYIRVNAAATRYSNGEVAVGGLGKEFYLPQQIPVGGGFSSQDFLVQARQTRFFLTTETPVGNKSLKSRIEFDFAISTTPAGAQRATNAFVPNLRLAYVTYGDTLMGQEWTTFQNVGVLPESTDFVGPIEGTVFVRQAMVRHTIALGSGMSLQVALENPETESIAITSPALVDNDDDRLPDFVGRLNVRTGKADSSLAAIVRELRVDQNGFGDTAIGWGVSAAGKIAFGPKNRNDLRFMATYGDGIGRYLGLGYVADVVFGGRPVDRLDTIRNFAGMAALKLGWSDRLRSTIMGGYQTSWYPAGVSPLNNRSAWSAAGNLFWTAAKNFDLGIEYRHAVRQLVNRDSGTIDRLEFAAKYSY